MSILVGYGGQVRPIFQFDASGSITLGGTSQLALEVSQSRSYLTIQNLHATSFLYVEFGSARATATIAGGLVTGFTITNGGFGFTYPPIIEFLGGGNGANSAYLGVGQPGYPSPGFSEGGGLPAITGDRPAKAHAVLTTGVVTSIVIDDPGQGYVKAPYVFMRNDPRDPFGCADPHFGGTPSGIQLVPAGSETWESSVCTTDPLAVWGPTTSQAFTLKYIP